MNGTNIVKATKEICEISHENAPLPPKQDNTPCKYVPLPGNADTLMVEFPKVTCQPTIISDSPNQVKNIADQYGSKQDLNTENADKIEDSQKAENVKEDDPCMDNMHSSSIDVSNNVQETFVQPITSSNNMLLDTNGNLKQIVYQQTFSGANITSVMEAAASGIKSPNKAQMTGVDEPDKKSSAASVNQSITESTSNEADNSTEITGSSEHNTTSTNTETTTNSNAQENTTNNTETGGHTSNEDNEDDDGDYPEQSDVEVDRIEPELSDAEQPPKGKDILNEDDLLGSQSDNPEMPIDPAREKALLDDSSSNLADKLSADSGTKKKKALLSPKARNLKRRNPNVSIISSDGKYKLH